MDEWQKCAEKAEKIVNDIIEHGNWNSFVLLQFAAYPIPSEEDDCRCSVMHEIFKKLTLGGVLCLDLIKRTSFIVENTDGISFLGSFYFTDKKQAMNYHRRCLEISQEEMAEAMREKWR